MGSVFCKGRACSSVVGLGQILKTFFDLGEAKLREAQKQEHAIDDRAEHVFLWQDKEKSQFKTLFLVV
jgi:hypothetical protein